MAHHPDFSPPRRLSALSQDRAHDAHGDAGIVERGGRVSSLGDAPAFTFTAPECPPLPVLIAVPHGGRAYCPDLLARMRAPDLCQLRLEDRHVDQLGIAIARQIRAALLVAHAPRAMLDLNRAETDIDWDMIEGPRLARPLGAGVTSHAANHRARSGLGLVPRRLPGHGEVWRGRLPHAELERRIDEIHQPYHSLLAQQLRRIRDAWGAALLIDLHSMPPLPSQRGEPAAPVMVLGDRFGASCHHSLMSRGIEFLGRQGLNAAQNRPYSGGYVLDRHGAPDAGIHAIQIEVCRSIYLDRDFAEITAAAANVIKVLAGLCEALGAQTAELGQGRQMLEAAE